jgi:hypothetical protein
LSTLVTAHPTPHRVPRTPASPRHIHAIFSKMNTISPPPRIRLSPTKRIFGGVAGAVVGITGGLAANALLGYSLLSFYTRETKFVPYDASSPDLQRALFQSHNPSSNPPLCIDHAVKAIPYAKLPAKYTSGSTADKAALATDFCRGVWSGSAYRVQRRYLERKYKALEGRDDNLWSVRELEKSGYEVGTKITDHFEVVEHSDDKV